MEIEWCVHLLSILPSLSPSRTSRLSQPGLVFSTDGLDQEQLAYCSKATFQLVKAKKFSKAVASNAFGFDASKGEPMIEELAVTEESVIQTLCETGSKDKVLGANMTAAADVNYTITIYSGGWKVKMLWACLQLVNAGILMITLAL